MDSTGKYSILIVDDEKANITALTHILSKDYVLYAAKNGKEAIEIAKKKLPDIILLDIIMPEMNGYEVLSTLKKDRDTKEIPVIFVTGLGSPESEENGLALGACDYISKPFRPSIIRLRIENQIYVLNQINKIKLLSITDDLTGISNRRDFDNRLQLEWERAKRRKTPLSIFMIDIDNFKEYNDTYGHIQGDAVLKTLAKIIKQSLARSIDYVARWGGEEFSVLLWNTNTQGALYVAEHIRKNVENTQIPIFHESDNNSDTTTITISIGVNTHIPAQESSMEKFISNVDQALYQAKRTGKNKVCKYEE